MTDDDTEAKPAQRGMDDDALLKLLRDEETDASAYYSSELAEAQANALARYHAQPYGDELTGKSQVVTHDAEDTVNWLMPKLMRALMESDDLISVDDPASDDQRAAADTADYIRHVLFQDNDGEGIVHDFAFDGLTQRVGFARTCWEDPQPKPPVVLEGLSQDQLAKYVADPEYQILEQSEDIAPAPEVQPGQMPAMPVVTYSIKVQHTPRMGRVVVEAIPPEEMAFSRRARSIERCDYVRWKREVFLADLVRQYPEHEAALLGGERTSIKDDEHEVEDDQRRIERFPDEPDVASKKASNMDRRRKGWLVEAEIRVDFDGDGVTELRHVKYLGDVLLENEMIEHSQFHTWTPTRVSHRMVGRSVIDPLLDLQRIKTQILRNTLDSMSQSLVPRTAVNRHMLTDDTIDTLLDADIGGVVQVNGDVREAMMPLVTPDLSAQGLAMLEYMDVRTEEATGVTRQSQGLRPQAITDTKGGIEALQAAANERIELIARWLGKGLQSIVEGIKHLIIAHQDQPRMVKVKGRPVQVDPRRWNDEMAVTVSVGMAVAQRNEKIMGLSLIAERQKEILVTAGPSNPVVGLPEYRNTLAMTAEAMGFRNPARFFKEVPEGWQPPAPQEDPKTTEAKAKLQLEQAKAQSDAQLAKEKFAFEAQMQQVRAETDKQIAAMKLQGEQEIAQLRIAAEQQIARERLAAETSLAREKARIDADVRREIGTHKASMNGADDGNGVRFGGQVG